MIDWARVAELRDEVGADDFDEVVELFLEEVQEVIDRIKTGVATDAIEPELHFLKGSALNLGFSELSGLCAKGEKDAANGDPDTAVLQQVVDTFTGSRDVFLQELPRRLN